MLPLPFKLNQAGRHHIPSQMHKVTNWPASDASLRQRGSLTVWFTDEAIEAWRAEPRTTRGGQPGQAGQLRRGEGRDATFGRAPPAQGPQQPGGELVWGVLCQALSNRISWSWSAAVSQNRSATCRRRSEGSPPWARRTAPRTCIRLARLDPNHD